MLKPYTLKILAVIRGRRAPAGERNILGFYYRQLAESQARANAYDFDPFGGE